MEQTRALGEMFRKYLTDHFRRIILGVLALAIFIAIWYLASWRLNESNGVLASYFPYPHQVARAFLASFTSPIPGPEAHMLNLAAASLERVLIGFGIALAISVPFGMLMGAFRTFEDLGKPIVEVFRPIPPIAWAGTFMFAFKAFWGPIAIVFVGAFFPILINVIFGVRSVDPVLMDAAKTLGASRKHIFTKVIVPSTLPYMMTGIKVGLGVAWMCIVAAEMLPIRGGGGLGYAIWTISDIGRYDYVYSIMIMIAILSILTAGVAGQVEQRLYKWMGMK